MKNILSGYLKRFVTAEKGCHEAHAYYAEFLFSECNNVFAAHYQLSKADADLLPIQLNMKKYILRRIIKQEVNPSSVGNKKYACTLTQVQLHRESDQY
jgi:hypothetical protein